MVNKAGQVNLNAGLPWAAGRQKPESQRLISAHTSGCEARAILCTTPKRAAVESR
jgi:hypothetical protein